jgi:pilus assembly protein CpaE
VNLNSHTDTEVRRPDDLDAGNLSIALIGPDAYRRRLVSAALSESRRGAVREFPMYPPTPNTVQWTPEQSPDVILIDLDSHQEFALALVEQLGTNGAATVMVYSEKSDSEMLMKAMRAGAREFFTLPFSNGTLTEALVRARMRSRVHREKKARGRLFVFFGAKGGAGVTTIATNFAVALAQVSSQSTVLIDLDFPLGDAALNLGITTEYSTVNALQNAVRLDSSFLAKLLSKHSSGVSVLAAPGKFPEFHASDEATDKLLAVAREDFENVVVDVGARFDLTGTALFKDAHTVYLVTQAGVPELRNANRLISQFFSGVSPNLEIVVNRYAPRILGINDEQIAKALTRPAQWRIPNDYPTVLRMQHTATPIVQADSPISRQIRLMAKAASGQPATLAKKKGFRLFG